MPLRSILSVRRSRKPIIIASRKSPLAQAQANAVGKALAKLNPKIDIQFNWIESEGDQHLNTPLSERGGKGLFTRSIEGALLNQSADIAVHSLKDMPTQEPEGLTLAAIPKRADHRDCLVSASGYESLADIPLNATLGTSSPRRIAQIKQLRPDIQTHLFRGNVNSRIEKIIDQKQFDATLMAVAGLKRAGLSQYAQNPLAIEEILPAACQGALAIQCRADDHVTLTRCLPLNHAFSAAAVHAERQILSLLQGDCHSPIAIYAQSTSKNDKAGYHIQVKVLSPDGTQCIQTQETDTIKEMRRLIKRIAKNLIEQGAKELLQDAARQIKEQLIIKKF